MPAYCAGVQMRRSLRGMAVVTAPILALAVLPAIANASARASVPTFVLVASVACTPGGDCAAGGRYGAASGPSAFVLSETNGKWGTAIEVPGLTGLNVRDAKVSAVSCAPGGCVAGGNYQDA